MLLSFSVFFQEFLSMEQKARVFNSNRAQIINQELEKKHNKEEVTKVLQRTDERPIDVSV